MLILSFLCGLLLGILASVIGIVILALSMPPTNNRKDKNDG